MSCLNLVYLLIIIGIIYSYYLITQPSTLKESFSQQTSILNRPYRFKSSLQSTSNTRCNNNNNNSGTEVPPSNKKKCKNPNKPEIDIIIESSKCKKQAPSIKPPSIKPKINILKQKCTPAPTRAPTQAPTRAPNSGSNSGPNSGSNPGPNSGPNPGPNSGPNSITNES